MMCEEHFLVHNLHRRQHFQRKLDLAERKLHSFAVTAQPDADVLAKVRTGCLTYQKG